MACINLYKIDSNKIDEFLHDLEICNFSSKKEKSYTKTINGEEYEFESKLFLDRPTKSETELSWKWLLDEFEEPPIEKWKSPKAILYINELRDESEEFYAVTFGSAFFKVDKYCDRDFGFKFAARIEYNNIKTTTLTAPNLKRNKTVNTYIDYNELYFDSGESFAKIKVNAKLEEDFELFKPALEIGTSIRFNTDKETLEGIVDIILYVEDILNIPDSEIKYKIPLFKMVKDEDLLITLNEKLNDALKLNIFENDDIPLLSIPELDIVGASEVFNGNDDEFEIKYYKSKEKVTNLSIDTLKMFCQENNIKSVENLEKIKIISYKSGDSVATSPLKKIIEYTDDENQCIFSGGKWYMYNHDYLTYLNDSIGEINVLYDNKFDFNDSIHNEFIDYMYNIEKDEEKYKDKSENDIKKELKSKYYAERSYNLIREWKDSFSCFDREDTGTLGYEKMDLYEPSTETMFAVKLGKSSAQLCYAIDQSLTSLKKYKHGEVDSMPKISKVGLWFVLERVEYLPEKDGNIDLTPLKMLMLKNRIDQWKKEVRLAGFTPIIYINYRKK